MCNIFNIIFLIECFPKETIHMQTKHNVILLVMTYNNLLFLLSKLK